MVGILDLPAEILIIIFGYLEHHDQKQAQLVCHQWNHHFSMPRYSKMRSLQLDPKDLKNETLDAVLRAAEMGKYHCIAIFHRIPINRTNEVLQLLEACRFSLDEIRLIDCNQSTLRSVYKTLGKMCRLRRLILDSLISARLPKVPRPDSEAAGFESVTHLKVSLTNDSYLKLVRSLAPQLTSLILRVVEDKKLLVQCLNEPRLTALHSLTVDAYSCLEEIQQDELGDACCRMLAQLESFQYTGNRIGYVMTEIIRNCRNLKRLAIFYCNVYVDCIKLICELKGLKYLNLNLYGIIDDTHLDPPRLIELPNLEELYLSPEIGLRMGKRWPKLTSIGFDTPLPAFASFNAEGILSDITKIDGISERRLRKLLLKAVCLDRAAIERIRTLAVDKLTFEDCRIDGSVFDVLLARPETRVKFLTIVMEQCIIIFASDAVYNVQTFEELVAQCPHLSIAHSEITFAFGDESPLF